MSNTEKKSQDFIHGFSKAECILGVEIASLEYEVEGLEEKLRLLNIKLGALRKVSDQMSEVYYSII